MLVVTADRDEEASGVPFVLEGLGVSVPRRHLAVGDYVCGPQTLVERKSVRDLQRTIVETRFWPQLGRLRDAAESPWLIVEGEGLYRGLIDADAVRGLLLAASDLGIAVIRSTDAHDTARWLLRLAERRQDGRSRDRPPYAHRPRRARRDPVAEAALASTPGISVVTARALLARFGTLYDVVVADPASWEAVPGVGPTRAAALRSLIHDEWPTDRASQAISRQRNGRAR